MSTLTYQAGTLYHLPPSELLLERNIRDASPSPELVESVRAVGVLEPITAVVNDDGALVVRYGHRRTMAAHEAGQPTVPVYVTGADDESDQAEIARIISQHDENTHRVGLTTADEIGVVEQLAAFGLTPDQIVKKARVKREAVDTATSVIESKLARKTAARHVDLTLDQVAAVAEFEDDPAIAKELILTAVKEPDRFPHFLQRQRDDRERAKAKAKAIAELTEQGITVVEMPGYDSRTKRLGYLVDAKTGKRVTPANHKDCPGHVAWIGYRGEPEYGCTAPGANGHRDTVSGSTPKQTADEMTDEEREKAKQARKLVIENNKAWASAETVRRAWLADFAKAKTAPKGAAAFIATGVTLDSGQFDYDIRPDQLASEWLGLKVPGAGHWDLTPAATKASEGRALQIVLVQILAVYEAKLTQQSWRSNGKTSPAGRYLRFLEACGYGLSDVERFAISERTA